MGALSSHSLSLFYQSLFFLYVVGVGAAWDREESIIREMVKRISSLTPKMKYLLIHFYIFFTHFISSSSFYYIYFLLVKEIALKVSGILGNSSSCCNYLRFDPWFFKLQLDPISFENYELTPKFFKITN